MLFESEAQRKLHTVPSSMPVADLNASEAFSALTAKEKRYVLHLSRASWEGAKICLSQTSREAPSVRSPAGCAVRA